MLSKKHCVQHSSCVFLKVKYMAIDRKEYFKKYREEHKEKKKEYDKVYNTHRLQHKEYDKEYSKRYRQKYKDEMREKTRNSPILRITNSLRNRLRLAVVRKVGRTMELTDCSIPELMKHLEKQFKEGMTWDNYGFRGWHIDHIRPCASFDLTLEEEQKACFHYSNLQPLWAEENLHKSNKWNANK